MKSNMFDGLAFKEVGSSTGVVQNSLCFGPSWSGLSQKINSDFAPYNSQQILHVLDLFTFKEKRRGCSFHMIILIFSSPELKAQVSFYDHLLSVCPYVCKLFTFSSSSQEPLGQFKPNLAQSILGRWGFKFIKIKDHALFQGEIITKQRKYFDKL